MKKIITFMLCCMLAAVMYTNASAQTVRGAGYSKTSVTSSQNSVCGNIGASPSDGPMKRFKNRLTDANGHFYVDRITYEGLFWNRLVYDIKSEQKFLKQNYGMHYITLEHQINPDGPFAIGGMVTFGVRGPYDYSEYNPSGFLLGLSIMSERLEAGVFCGPLIYNRDLDMTSTANAYLKGEIGKFSGSIRLRLDDPANKTLHSDTIFYQYNKSLYGLFVDIRSGYMIQKNWYVGGLMNIVDDYGSKLSGYGGIETGYINGFNGKKYFIRLETMLGFSTSYDPFHVGSNERGFWDQLLINATIRATISRR